MLAWPEISARPAARHTAQPGLGKPRLETDARSVGLLVRGGK